MKDETRRKRPDSDWLNAVQQHTQPEQGELEFDSLKPGDRLQVRTQHTLYDFTWSDGGTWEADLQTDRADRPGGHVQLVGCALGAGSTIAPGRLFNGGGLEYTSEGGKWVHRTTAILWIRLLRHLSP